MAPLGSPGPRGLVPAGAPHPTATRCQAGGLGARGSPRAGLVATLAVACQGRWHGIPVMASPCRALASCHPPAAAESGRCYRGARGSGAPHAPWHRSSPQLQPTGGDAWGAGGHRDVGTSWGCRGGFMEMGHACGHVPVLQVGMGTGVCPCWGPRRCQCWVKTSTGTLEVAKGHGCWGHRRCAGAQGGGRGCRGLVAVPWHEDMVGRLVSWRRNRR